jgi:hypothetical protein
MIRASSTPSASGGALPALGMPGGRPMVARRRRGLASVAVVGFGLPGASRLRSGLRTSGRQMVARRFRGLANGCQAQEFRRSPVGRHWRAEATG